MLNVSPIVKSFALEEAAANNGGGAWSIILMVLVYALVIGALWFRSAMTLLPSAVLWEK